MSAAPETLRETVRRTLLRRVARTGDAGRAEALTAFVGLSRPGISPEAARIIVEKTPRLLPQLTEKWIGMFVDRLFETVPLDQISLLCDGSGENEAAMALAYVMFLESERMEKQMAEDLAACDLPPGEDGSDLAADVLRRLAKAEEKHRQAAQAKASAYARSRRDLN
ncbi:hypothetical protein [Solidesulfovibrio sp.]|jgi:hypothetical protein|uniref:hypothetical protein n=1 Tax=Solidesulfovibrio sp. TaxID=2910990 RepID=UPI000EE389CA|nr:hypothetical protein [Solidesulfovibrio sp.]MEA5090879.1 hypothetical protein [Solidesulfovibrio sp.]HCR12313.1 hypothetical protein [Desulfovibrio sp.]HML62068.1 hypothetical protein [Solidesulfovibrio sp.]